MKEIERKYLKSLFVVFIVLLVGSIFSLIYALVDIYKNETILNNILELLYMAVHIIILVMGLLFTLSAIRSNKGSHIMKSLMITPNTRLTSKPARAIAIIFSTIGLGTCIYFILVLCGMPLPYFHFPITLLLILVNSPFTLFIVGLYFIFYPYIFHKCLKEDEQK